MAYRYIEQMRQRLGLGPGDESRDTEIEKMSPMDRLRLLCGWHIGDPNWAQSFMNWATDSGFKIVEKK